MSHFLLSWGFPFGHATGIVNFCHEPIHSPPSQHRFCRVRERDKVTAHRKLRRKVTGLLHAAPDVEVLPGQREVSNVMDWEKAPRVWFADTCRAVPKLLRK